MIKNLGFRVEEVALVFTVMPLLIIPGNALAGILTDKLGTYKPIILICIIFATGLYTPMLFIPRAPGSPPVVTTMTCRDRLSRPVISASLCPGEDTDYCPLPELIGSVELSECHWVCNKTHGTDNTQISNATFHSEHFLLSNTAQNQTIFITTELQPVKETCSFHLTNFTVNDEFYNDMTCEKNDNDCRVSCVVSLPELTVSRCPEPEGRHFRTFVLGFFCTVVSQVFYATGFVIYDACIFAMLKDNPDSNYGVHRMFAIIGKCVFMPLSGVLVTTYSGYIGYTSYLPAFILSNVTYIVTIVLTCLINVKATPTPKGMTKEMLKLVRHPHVLFYFIIVIFLGMAWGYIQIFVFWHLQDLGGSPALIGMIGAVGSAVGVPVLLVSDKVIRVVGEHNILTLACLAYGIRFVIYSILKNPWWALLLEGAGEVISIHLAYVAIAVYGNKIGGDKLKATIQSFVRPLHFYAGRSVGSVYGGIAVSAVGPLWSMRLLAVIMIVAGLLYWIYQRIRIHNIHSKAANKNRETEEYRREIDETTTALSSEIPQLLLEEKITRDRASSLPIEY